MLGLLFFFFEIKSHSHSIVPADLELMAGPLPQFLSASIIAVNHHTQLLMPFLKAGQFLVLAGCPGAILYLWVQAL